MSPIPRPSAPTNVPASTAPQHQPFIYDTGSFRRLHFNIGDIQSCMRVNAPDSLVLDYTRTMMGFLLFNPEPERIGMVGLGGGSLAKFCHRYLPRTRIEVAEINPLVIALRDEFQIPRDGDRFQVFQCDGVDFVRSRADRFDVLIVDGYDLQGLAACLNTQSFYDDCRDALRPHGLLVVNLHYDAVDTPGQIARIHHSFEEAVLVVDDDELCHQIVFSSRGGALENPALAAARRPENLETSAYRELSAAFAMTASALKARPS